MVSYIFTLITPCLSFMLENMPIIIKSIFSLSDCLKKQKGNNYTQINLNKSKTVTKTFSFKIGNLFNYEVSTIQEQTEEQKKSDKKIK